MDIVNAFLKFESQILSNKQYTKFEILWFVNKPRLVIVYIYVALV